MLTATKIKRKISCPVLFVVRHFMCVPVSSSARAGRLSPEHNIRIIQRINLSRFFSNLADERVVFSVHSKREKSNRQRSRTYQPTVYLWLNISHTCIRHLAWNLHLHKHIIRTIQYVYRPNVNEWVHDCFYYIKFVFYGYKLLSYRLRNTWNDYRVENNFRVVGGATMVPQHPLFKTLKTINYFSGYSKCVKIFCF